MYQIGDIVSFRRHERAKIIELGIVTKQFDIFPDLVLLRTSNPPFEIVVHTANIFVEPVLP